MIAKFNENEERILILNTLFLNENLDILLKSKKNENVNNINVNNNNNEVHKILIWKYS